MSKAILTEHEARVIGCMIEKQLTTPQYYPMTQNSVRVACNQKSNRDPVVDYSDNDVFDILRSLEDKGYAEIDMVDFSRATRYRQLFGKVHELERGELVILCELFIRGPQTPGELRSRCERMYKFKDLAEVERCLQQLVAKQFVTMLERLPGTKENRWAQLFCGEPKISPPSSSGVAAPARTGGDLEGRVARLEEELRTMGERMAALEAQIKR
jgi:uncharacterized protein YceH (UPF0502 family)